MKKINVSELAILRSGRGDCPKTKTGTDSDTRHSAKNDRKPQYNVVEKSKGGVFGQSVGAILTRD